jgi:hypothetical protein
MTLGRLRNPEVSSVRVEGKRRKAYAHGVDVIV